MHLGTRKVLDRSFTGLGSFSIVLVAAALVVLLAPIIARGATAFVFRGTVEYRRMMRAHFDSGDQAAVEAEVAAATAARQPIYDALASFEQKLPSYPAAQRRAYRESLDDLKTNLRTLLGPLPGDPPPALVRDAYGQTRWDRAQLKLRQILYVQTWDYGPDGQQQGRPVFTPRVNEFKGTAVEPIFEYLPTHLAELLRPQLTFYWRFLFDTAVDAHFFGGIWPEVLGTLCLTLGAIFFAVPMGIVSAIYLVEYAGENWLVSLLRSCISTLAGVPSIVFGLFGLAFFINALHVSPAKSVLTGSLTLALLILPMVIRASEEALRAVPRTFKEAALSVGASKWHAIVTVVFPAALPGILTGVVISMGRAAGETAPIIFTAAVSAGPALRIWETLTQPTPALPWNIYNLCTEHAAVDEIRHVQYGMVLTLLALVLALNGAALVARARIARRLSR